MTFILLLRLMLFNQGKDHDIDLFLVNLVMRLLRELLIKLIEIINIIMIEFRFLVIFLL